MSPEPEQNTPKTYEKDPVLISFIKNVEEAEKNDDLLEEEKTMNIILNVKGVVISGKLISYKKYSDLLEESLTSNTTGGNENETTKITDEDTPQETPSDRNYIHLRDTKFHVTAGYPLPVNNGFLWRGKVSSIDGFIPGSSFVIRRSSEVDNFNENT